MADDKTYVERKEVMIKFAKGLWMKLPEDGFTRLSRAKVVSCHQRI